jgi:putative membrane protein
MIRGYSDHAANERTFLAWVRTAIAVIAFGLVIEKFNLFVLAMANANSLDPGRRLQLERLSGPLGRYDGLALILLEIAVVVVAATRFVRTGQLLDDQETHSVGGVRADLLVSAALALIVAGSPLISRSVDETAAVQASPSRSANPLSRSPLVLRILPYPQAWDGYG